MAVLERRLGAGSAVVIGLASMIGAGVFFVWAPAADAAGGALLVGLVIAGVVATLNALSTAQLAMQLPVSGGSYAYGRALRGERTGFTAGTLFLAGKTASAAAIAVVAGQYLWPDQARAVAVVVVVALAAVNASGIRSTAGVSAAIVTVVLAGLVVALVAVAVAAPEPEPFQLGGAGVYGVLQAAGLMFFSFAGYARLATLGEEVRDPRRTLPRAILAALGIALVLYATIATVLLVVLGPDRLAASASPLADLLGGGWDPVIRLLAGIACVGSLLNILAGLSRTSLAMARNRDLPGGLAHISRRSTPVVAELVVAAVAIIGVLVLPAGALIGFSSCAVLGYYAIAHFSALAQSGEHRWLPRWVHVVGLTGCLVLAVTLPWQAVLGAVLLLAVALGARELLHRRA
ncbi:APC family permease [Herbiconiux sp. SYSU D00978]|uniref:APC family permease n=1 Tax=Herbiconiux sp. SYSU D00978 TaxID=2812562 RepID=UPI001A96E319|nr:APC family permease [Herbiconiux sp. SYSU D00978]